MEKFLKISPPLFHGTETGRLPKRQLERVMAWQHNPRGLLLSGETGKGKTRTAWTLLKRVLTEDKPEREFLWFNEISFGHEMVLKYRSDEAESWLDSLVKVPLLFIDDLGKMKLTDRAESEMFWLIDQRCEQMRPVIVTTNDTGETLTERMTASRGPALIRRLREFCEPMQF